MGSLRYFRMVRLKISNSLSTNSLSLNSIKRGSSSSLSWYSSATSSGSSWYSSTSNEFSFNSLSTKSYSLKSYYELAKINTEVNLLKSEEKQRQKVRKIMGGSEYQIVAFESISNPNFYNGVMLCVFINILLLIMPTMPSETGHNFRRMKNAMDCIDDFFMSVYLVECLLKIYVLRKEYFKGWDLLDFNIVLISLFDTTIGMLDSFSPKGSVLFSGTVSSSGLKVTKVLRLLRATRMFRVLRTLKFIDRLQRYTVTILKSTQSLGPIMHLTGAFVFMATSLGCSLFGGMIPKHFGNIILTFFTLIKIITLDEWFEIQQEKSVEYGFNPPLSLYLGGFIFIMVFVVFNLLLAVLVDTFNVSNDESRWKLE